ncbi:MAG: Serine--tRNA ligase [Chlamydiia bacterium]|nr:Serine--tRNA ligase [Chlamydiia bacterium]MCH9616117.1 Serine--tRNA ligase [Chlamydiia bacterium]MCH9629460.1 Serine--tRNA ligase [Chlamydiia bacterium]
MLDIKLIRENAKALEAKLKTKDPEIDLKPILEMDEKARGIMAKVEELKAKRNELSKQIGLLKREKKDASGVMSEVTGFGEQIQTLDSELKTLQETLQDLLARLPNIPQDQIKVAMDPEENVCIKTFGDKRDFEFEPKNHVELNETLHYFDFKRGAKISGTGWPVYTGKGAELEWALINYMLDIHRKNGFTQIMPPHMVRPEIMYGCSQFPKFKDQVYRLKDEDYELYTIPTAEAALNGLHYDEIIPEESLPIKYTAYTPCFRREAGAAGSQERGLIRIHQFNKVEMFCFTKPDESEAMFEKMMASAEEVLEGLNMHYRNMLLVTGDMSFASAKTVDIEVYLPGQNRYYEVSSVSHCTDFQSRRSKTRAKKGNDKPYLVHTLNGSGVATSRLMVALLENNQNADGTINLPPVLLPYLHASS